MVKIRKIKVAGGKVTERAVFDSDNVPDWAAVDGWIDAPQFAAIGDTDNGDGTYGRPVDPQPTDAEKDAAATKRADRDMAKPFYMALAETVFSNPGDANQFRVNLEKQHRGKM